MVSVVLLGTFTVFVVVLEGIAVTEVFLVDRVFFAVLWVTLRRDTVVVVVELAMYVSVVSAGVVVFD